jgi:sterol desaturase/sphingolipid hydroxylase (fatty acid hydroxylase superfamily)
MGKPLRKVDLTWKLLFSVLSGLFGVIACLAVLGVGIIARWWTAPSAATVLWVAAAAFAATFFPIFVWLLEISYYVDHDHDVV